MLNYSFKDCFTPKSMTRQRKMRLFHLFDSVPSLGVLFVAYSCMPVYGWTHQPACVQTCLVCSLLWNNRVPCSQTRSPDISLAPSEHVLSSILQRLAWKVCWHSSFSVQAPHEISPLEKISCCGKLHNLMAAISSKIGTVVYSFRKN